MFGLGGIFAESLGDVVFRVAPVEHRDALAMLDGIRAHRILGAVRGMKAVDRHALCASLMALGRIASEHPEIAQVDVNPLIVRDDRPIAVDALVVLDAALPGTVEVHGGPSRAPREAIRRFFEPRSVAVVGASAAPGKPGNVVIKNILAMGFAGTVHLVNPRGGEIEGMTAHRSIESLPDGIDQAIVTLPAAQTPATVRALAARGIDAIVLAASGFAEVDQIGEELQADLIRAIRESGVRVIGPNTTGHVSVPGRFTSSFFPLGAVRGGSVSYVTQTGNFCGISLRHILSAEHYGIARSIGLGNKADVDEADLLEYLGGDPATRSIFLYLESIREPRRFLAAARRVAAEKPVIMLKGGVSEAGAAAAVAHTAALAADGRIVDGALAQAGVTRIHRYSDLFHVAKALDAMPLPAGNRISFLSPSGAFTVCLTDLSRSLGLVVPALEDATRVRLQALAPPFIRMRNPVDIYGSVALHGYERAYGDALDAVLSDPNIDAVVAILMLTPETGVPALDFIVDLARKHAAKPLYVTFMGAHEQDVAAKMSLEPRGVPCYMEVEQPFEVLAVLARCRETMTRVRAAR
jgi:acyl-CoA synthetase (NDP forming)